MVRGTSSVVVRVFAGAPGLTATDFEILSPLIDLEYLQTPANSRRILCNYPVVSFPALLGPSRRPGSSTARSTRMTPLSTGESSLRFLMLSRRMEGGCGLHVNRAVGLEWAFPLLVPPAIIYTRSLLVCSQRHFCSLNHVSGHNFYFFCASCAAWLYAVPQPCHLA